MTRDNPTTDRRTLALLKVIDEAHAKTREALVEPSGLTRPTLYRKVAALVAGGLVNGATLRLTPAGERVLNAPPPPPPPPPAERDLLLVLLVARLYRFGNLYALRFRFDESRWPLVDELVKRGWLNADASLTPEGETQAAAHKAAVKEWRYDALPRTRADALLIKSRAYFTGDPCKHGHTAPKLTRNYTCVVCSVVLWPWRPGKG